MGPGTGPGQALLQAVRCPLVSILLFLVSNNQSPVSYSGSDVQSTGTAIYVYGVAFSEAFLPANLSITQLTFALDGQPTSSSYNAKPWPQTPQNVLDFEYNTLVYSKTGLSNDTHILQITLPHISEQLDNAFIFDYAQYTYVTHLMHIIPKLNVRICSVKRYHRMLPRRPPVLQSLLSPQPTPSVIRYLLVLLQVSLWLRSLVSFYWQWPRSASYDAEDDVTE